MANNRKIKGAVDLISMLPDVILQHILCFIPTKLAISTSILSRRWRHVWCDTPSLSLDADTCTAASINKTLTRYTAPKLMNFQFKTTMKKNIPHIDRWIKFAMSHNVENMSLDILRPFSSDKYKLPDFFYINSSVKQLNIKLSFSHTMVPACTVSWTSLKKLSLSCCRLFDESMAKILSGCPILENLALRNCPELKVLDLRKSLRLRTLTVKRDEWFRGPILQIVAPHIHCLILLNSSKLSCALVDVASLTEAKLNSYYVSTYPNFKTDFLRDKVLKMLQKLENAEKLTFGGTFIKVLSLAETRGVHFPMFKVKALTLDHIDISEYYIPCIERLLQNSPGLEKLTVRTWNYNTVQEYFDEYLKLQGLNPSKCWRSRDEVSWKVK